MAANDKYLSGKVALVTGASRGIGAAIARRLGAAGATVLVNYNKAKPAADAVVADIRAAGGSASALRGDVGVTADVDRLFADLDASHGGKLDVLVNNAGVYLTGPLSEFSSDDFRKTFDTNVVGMFEVTRRAVKRMTRGGRIVNIGSIVGERVPFPGISAYAASKFAVSGLTRGWSRELAAAGITVNNVQPGPVDTDMNPADMARNPMADTMRSMVPLGRYGHADEVAALVAHLTGPDAAFITGATFSIDGGVIA